MKEDCAACKDQLLEAALGETIEPELRQHLLSCPACTAEFSALRARREQMDALLPRVAQEADLSPDFRARVLAGARAGGQSKHVSARWSWVLAGGAAVVLAALLLSFLPYRRVASPGPEADLAAAQKLAEWRAPTDVFLATSGNELLRNAPKLGESYLPAPAQAESEALKEK
ncbi:MAG: hypothetical protein ABSG69_12855 [Candidatus Acidiferrum sp.]|jgi:hypothetical protein